MVTSRKMDASFIARVPDVLILECSQKAQQIPGADSSACRHRDAASHTCINIYTKDLNFTHHLLTHPSKGEHFCFLSKHCGGVSAFQHLLMRSKATHGSSLK